MEGRINRRAAVRRRASAARQSRAGPRRARTAFRSCLGYGVGIAILLLTALPRPAIASHDAARLAELIQTERYEKAYQLARGYLGEHAGEPLFDLYYGIAAVETGHLSKGIFALERVLIARPGAARARLELARAYFLRGNDRRAARAFRIVERHEPPPAVQAQIDRYQFAIERRAERYRTDWSGYIELGIGYDTNVNRATASDTVDTIIGPVALDPAVHDREDSFGRIEGRLRLSQPVAPGFNLIASIGGRGRFYEDQDRFDAGRVSGRVGALLRGRDWRLRATVFAGRYFLDGEAYREAVGIGTTYRISLDERSLASVSLSVIDLHYATQESLDSTLWLFGVELRHRFASENRPTLSLRVYAGTENADADSIAAQANAERNLLGLEAGLRLWLGAHWTFRGTVGVRISNYAEPGLLFEDARDEETYRLELALDWRPTPHWRIGPYVEYTNRQSNIRLYEYERTEIGLRARYLFE